MTIGNMRLKLEYKLRKNDILTFAFVFVLTSPVKKLPEFAKLMLRQHCKP